MGLFNYQEVNRLRIQIFAIGKNSNYENFFTLIRHVRAGDACPAWNKISGPGNSKMFEGFWEEDEGLKIIEDIKANKVFKIPVADGEENINYGILMEREEVFVPNTPGAAAGTGWWPGTLGAGFFLKQWYPAGYDMSLVSEKNYEKAFDFVKSRTGVDIEHLQDFMGSIIYIPENISYKPQISYNQENSKVIFRIQGSVPERQRKVTIELWEGKECCKKLAFDLVEGQKSLVIDTPFAPSQLGYEIYEQDGEGYWQLESKALNFLINKMGIDMGIVTGTLNVVKPTGEVEEHKIVTRDRRINIDNKRDEKQPWLNAEHMRTKLNKGQALKELGSMFVRYSGNETQKKMRQIILERIFEKASEILWIWDPYIDGSLFTDISIIALKRPSLDVRLLLSECRGERNGTESSPEIDEKTKEALEISMIPNLNNMPRCRDIYNFLNAGQEAMVRLQKQGNLKVRNWFRSSQHAFHDRFIICDAAVWHLGSSLKDLGNFHSTLYRLDGDLPDEVQVEFIKAWDGDFSPMEPEGIELFPKLRYLQEEDQNHEKV